MGGGEEDEEKRPDGTAGRKKSESQGVGRRDVNKCQFVTEPNYLAFKKAVIMLM